MRFHHPSCVLFTGNVGRGEKGYSSLSYVCTLFFLLDEHDLPLYSSFFSILSCFFLCLCVYVEEEKEKKRADVFYRRYCYSI